MRNSPRLRPGGARPEVPMLRVLALSGADKAWALRQLDAALLQSRFAVDSDRDSASRLAELNAARAALCREPLFVVAAGEAGLARGAWRLVALGVSVEATASGRTRALLLNDVLVGRSAAQPRPATAPAPLGTEPSLSLRRFAARMAAALPATPPATPVARRLRRTRSSDAAHINLAPPRAQDAPPPPRRLRSSESAMPRAASPLFSFRCPITHALMEDPVVAADGHSYERAAIARWLLRSQRSPCTNVPMAHARLLPNHSMRAAIAEYSAAEAAPAEPAATA